MAEDWWVTVRAARQTLVDMRYRAERGMPVDAETLIDALDMLLREDDDVRPNSITTHVAQRVLGARTLL